MIDSLSAHANAVPQLFTSRGALVSVSISVQPRLLEDLIEALAGLSFPVNPQLYHRPGVVYVEFPAYENDLPEVRRLLESSGLDEPLRLEARPPSYVPVL